MSLFIFIRIDSVFIFNRIKIVSKFISSRIKKDEDQGKERCHTKSMMGNWDNERIKYTLNTS